ncbi:MAG: helix-turn-helix domain-containing protein [Firmicutes bacterium]|nr:helix-turn-helix domain-containing protein [Bacillota bacterium]
MIFTEKIRKLREERQMPQRQFAAALEIDTATYCKIEKGERRVKREQVVIIAKLLQVDSSELLILWLAEQVIEVVKDEKELADKALDIAQKENKRKIICSTTVNK